MKWAQSNGIIERFHRTLLDEHFRVEGRRTWFETIEEMQGVLDDYLVIYNTRCPHQRRGMNGRTPAQAFIKGLPNASQQEETARPKQTKIKTA
ncbi:MAG: transposase [Methylobacterium sp.]|nr:transposase [Cupriavidus sp.]MCA3657810.1 transposase [Methylobacterium sp.]MCA3671321.1 transposase [Methylobacterium sp.]MCA3678497.1 transposase [Methylobacterium sp.]MCA3680419.1 transposase [Methylobacterium sp.]